MLKAFLVTLGSGNFDSLCDAFLCAFESAGRVVEAGEVEEGVLVHFPRIRFVSGIFITIPRRGLTWSMVESDNCRICPSYASPGRNLRDDRHLDRIERSPGGHRLCRQCLVIGLRKALAENHTLAHS